LTTALAQLPAATAAAVQNSYSLALTTAQLASTSAALASQAADDFINSSNTAAGFQINNDPRTATVQSMVTNEAAELNAEVQAANVAAQAALTAMNTAAATLTSAVASATGTAATTLATIDNTIVQVAAQNVQTLVTQALNLVPSAISLATDAAGIVVGHALAIVIGEPFELLAGGDMLVPSGPNQENETDRGLVTHEYGHFAFCNLLNSIAPGDFAAIYDTAAAESVITSNNDSSQTAAVLNESFADLIAAQVVGGTNYAAPPGSTPSVLKTPGNAFMMNYCPGAVASSTDPAAVLGLSPPGPCMENNQASNVAGTSIDFHPAVFRNVGMFTDVLDGNIGGNNPSNGAPWGGVEQGGFIQIAGRPGDAGNDDVVAVNGATFFRSWITHLINRGASLSETNAFGGLNDAMVDQSFNWCARCQIFALHTNDDAGNPTCPTDWVGPRPTISATGQALACTFENMNTCPMGTTANNSTRVCEPGCPVGQVFNDLQLACVPAINVP